MSYHQAYSWLHLPMGIECDQTTVCWRILYTKGHAAPAGELAAMGFEYTKVGGAYVNSPVDDRGYILKTDESF